MPDPALIGRYRVEKRLGAGGFAVVWLARDESLGTLVAIKVMAEHWADRMDLRERFVTEARMLRAAASPRLVQVFDIGETADSRPYFVMEYADGGTLADRIDGAPLPLEEALRLSAEVARGVAELHQAGIVHRDVKPSNVLIASGADGAERLLLADLGVAKQLAQASALTMTVGSAGYMAPEQAEPGTGLDVRADVYSLGALSYRLITGVVPGPPGQLLAVERLRPGVPRELRRLLARALQPDRERRWPAALSLAERLEAIAVRLAGQRSARWAARWSGRRRVAVAGGLAVVLAVALAGSGAGVALYESGRPVRLHDDSGRIEVRVPRSWARQLVPGGWNPSVIGLPAQQAAGLLITADTRRWADLAQPVNGMFVGIDEDAGLPAAVAKLTHPGCTDRGRFDYSDTRWKGRIHRFECGGSGTVEEISLSPAPASGTSAQVYVQIRQDGGNEDARVLAGLRIGT